MDLELLKGDVVKASHILHQQGIAAAFGHVSAYSGDRYFHLPAQNEPGSGARRQFARARC